jgi:hypothetical protein
MPNLSAAETADANYLDLTATGFISNFQSIFGDGINLIYIAIRRGPMKVPTTGTSVLGLSARTGTGANATVTGSAGVTDLAIIKNRGATTNWVWTPRLTGTGYLSSNNTDQESNAGATILQSNPWDVMDGVKVGTTEDLTNASGNTFINYLIDRAPGFFDVVCASGSVTPTDHNLGVAPELIIRKRRDFTPPGSAWSVTSRSLLGQGQLLLNSTAAYDGGVTVVGSVTSTQINWNSLPGGTMVLYLFASCPGVSKVGTYNGTGTTLQINCGFTAGSRFVLIKRTDSTGDWYVWDSARGIVAGNDPYILPNSTAAEVTSTDYVDTFSSGFEISSAAPAAINANGGTYIFLAIA